MRLSINHSGPWSWTVIGIVVLGGLLRFGLLDLKAPHHDEGVNGSFVDSIQEKGFYSYSPENYHGPINYYLLFVSVKLFGRNIWALRLPVALLSLLTVLLYLSFYPMFSKRACRIAALFAAVSPGLIYYGRSVMQEAALAFFTVLWARGCLGVLTQRDRKNLWFLGLGLAGMILSKETFLINVCVLFLAAFFTALLAKTIRQKSSPAPTALCDGFGLKDILLVGAVSAGLVVFFYSDLFKHPQKSFDFLRSYFFWSKTGLSGHKKPIYYWLKLLGRYEWSALAGLLVSFIGAFTRRPIGRPVRALSFYSLGIFAAYSLIPYKTPWCIPSLIWPSFLILGFYADQLFEKEKAFVASLLLSLFALNLISTFEINFVRFENDKEPYVYVQTSRQVYTLKNQLEMVGRATAATRSLKGKILGDYLWPLPWLLKSNNFKIDWYARFSKPEKYDCDFLIVSPDRELDTRLSLRGTYFIEPVTVFTDRKPYQVFYKQNVFAPLFPGRVPEFVPAAPQTATGNQGLTVSFLAEATKGLPYELVTKNISTQLKLSWDPPNRLISGPFRTQWSGQILIPSESVEFKLTTDDGGSLAIDGKRIIDDPGPHAEKAATGTYRGSAGWHSINIEHHDEGGGTRMELLWKTDATDYRTIPADALKPDTKG